MKQSLYEKDDIVSFYSRMDKQLRVGTIIATAQGDFSHSLPSLCDEDYDGVTYCLWTYYGEEWYIDADILGKVMQ